VATGEAVRRIAWQMSRRTELKLDTEAFGQSVRGVSIEWIAPLDRCRVLLIAGIHGEEPDTTVALSRAYRSVATEDISPFVGSILCANPDGAIAGTRCNANGVDLNRNFPTQNWQPESTTCRWFTEDPREDELAIKTGDAPGSEPETRALLKHIDRVRPELIIALHGPLACIDDPHSSPAGKWIAERTGLPLVSDIGYPTPGSMGTWAGEADIPLITWEFPKNSIEDLSRTQTPTIADILQGALERD